eukprot:6172992-Pleurochrysis_carterae.AAC.2
MYFEISRALRSSGPARPLLVLRALHGCSESFSTRSKLNSRARLRCDLRELADLLVGACPLAQSRAHAWACVNKLVR